jgi:hypothetical protein
MGEDIAGLRRLTKIIGGANGKNTVFQKTQFISVVL